MSDIKLFRTENGTVRELQGRSATIEKSLQTQIERHMEEFLGVRFLASEHLTGKAHGGRIDSLGLDENGCPVIIEYKRTQNENVINQGLFYLDWLMEHKADFKLLVLEKFGKESADGIEYGSTRLLCIAGDFTKYDEHAVKQINRNIELIRYRLFDDDLLLLELVNATSTTEVIADDVTQRGKVRYTTVSEFLDKAPQLLKDLYADLSAFLNALGDDVQMKHLKFYIAYKRIKNFACVEVHPQSGKLLVFLKVDPDSITLEKGFSRDVRNIGHFGTGDLELSISSIADFEKSKPMLQKSYEIS
jgi:predicted transport protein